MSAENGKTKVITETRMKKRKTNRKNRVNLIYGRRVSVPSVSSRKRE